MNGAVEWRWVDVSGEQHAVRLDELTDALSTGALPRFVLIWRAGFAGWCAAEDVPELGKALGVDEPVSPDRLPRLDPKVTAPPAPPLGKYAEPLGGQMPATLFRPKPAVSTNPPPPARARAPLEPPPARAGVSVPIPVRDVLPTLAELELPERSPTLRPAGALPPPPRTVPLQTRKPLFGTEDDSHDALPEPRGKSIPPPLPASSVPPRPEEHPASEAGVAPSSGLLGRRWLTRRLVAVATAAGLVWPGAALITFLIAKRTAPPPMVREVLGPVGGVLIRPTQSGCAVSTPAARLAEPGFIGVPLLVATAPGGAGVAVGFAETKNRALGITVNPDSLAVAQTFEENGENALVGVVPLVASGSLSFHADRTEAPLAFERTVDAHQSFAIGSSAEGVSKLVDKEPELLWPSKAKNPSITAPRVAAVPGTGYLVAFRSGGQEGKILVGWLDDEGKRKTEVRAPDTDATLVGTPAVAVGESVALVAYSAKTTASEPWHLETAAFPIAGLPERARLFAIPAGGPTGESIAPSLEELPRNRFLFQWTEGSAGNRAVRAEVLTGDLVPIGEPITLSAPDQNAGQGALWADGNRAMAFFFVKGDTNHALFGASLRCP